MTSCSDDATVRLVKFTDIDTAGTNAHVSFVHRNDLDQPGYTIVVPKDRQQAFERAFENAAGKDCLRLVIISRDATTIKRLVTTFLLKDPAR
jgi:hypothetical protein